ncbi:hypothetical protein DMENIID0001_124260 [Sergentomyia squamirostris]
MMKNMCRTRRAPPSGPRSAPLVANVLPLSRLSISSSQVADHSGCDYRTFPKDAILSDTRTFVLITSHRKRATDTFF